MTAAIYFHPEAYTTAGPKLMGRNAAGESFLRGFLAYSKTDEFWVQTQQSEHASAFAAMVKGAGRTQSVRAVDQTSLAALAEVGVTYFPGPGIGQHARQRSYFGDAKWSLCGITHTTSSALAMDALADLIVAPVQPWDAVICTSAAVKENVMSLLRAQIEYLRTRLGVAQVVLPLLPVIPLGIHTSDFVFREEQKIDARRSIGADEQTLVVLFMGRLSFHAKAHPLAMYQALENASRGRQVVLVECGWHANTHVADAYRDAASLACPNVRVVNLDGRRAEDRQTAWASADIFCSLSDNIQETFGIVPIEAMAAGLPVVVSDWDGYKDTVRDGVDGFRIPTLMPATELGGDLALRHALEIDTYDMYCGLTCSLVAVDVEATTHAFEQLFASRDLRRRLGEAGRQRARQDYDWAAIIPRYEALWDEQREMRIAHDRSQKPLGPPWPARMDPFHAFANYPTRTLGPQTLVGLAAADAATSVARVAKYKQLAMVNFAKYVFPTEVEIELVLNAAESGVRPAVELLAGIATDRQAFVFRALAWLLKLGVLKIYR